MTDQNLYVRGQNRDQLILFPGSIEEYIDEDNAVRVVDSFVEGLDLEKLGFNHCEPKDDGGRPSYDPRDMLKTVSLRLSELRKDEQKVGEGV